MSDQPKRYGMPWLLLRSLLFTPAIVGLTGVAGFAWWYAALPAFIINFIYWYRYNVRHHAQNNFSRQINAQLIALTYYLGVYLVTMAITGTSYIKVSGFYGLTIFPYNLSAIAGGGLMLMDFLPWLFIGTFWSGALGTWAYQWRHNHSLNLQRPAITMLVVALFASLLPAPINFFHGERYLGLNAADATNASDLKLSDYLPFAKKSKVAKLDQPATLQISSHHPKINGATAAYPVESAIAQALYTKIDAKTGQKLVKSDSTPKAFNSLLNKQSDVIFIAKPSDEQLKQAKKQHVAIQQTHVANEAFIFFVNRKNPVNSLTTKQIQQIYQRKTLTWAQLGGHLTPIQAFQRPANSGSQTAMESLVMQNKKLGSPMRYQVADTMGGVIDDVAGYNNSEGAIGYSFRFFATQMKINKNVKLLKVNGVAPTAANIRNGKYPYIASVYAITRADATRNTRALVNWTTSPQGQQLINNTGYVGLK